MRLLAIFLGCLLLERGLESSPEFSNPRPRLNLGQIYQKQKMVDEALQSYMEVAVNPRSRTEMLAAPDGDDIRQSFYGAAMSNIASLEINRGNVRAATAILEDLIQSEPSAPVVINLAAAYFGSNQPDLALSVMRLHEKTAKENYAYWFIRAKILTMMNRCGEANAMYETAYQLSGDPAAHLHCGQ